jgi:hypothetical protein
MSPRDASMRSNGDSIVLVTRAIARNQGNVTLSRVWRDLLTDIYPERQITVLERIPDFLKRYRLADFERAADPVAAFDSAARSLADVGRQAATVPCKGDEIALDRSAARPVRFPRLRQLMKLRQRLAALGVYDAARNSRQARVARAGLFVMNAAGEFLPKLTDTPLQYLLDLRAAQLLGIPTAFVNTSFEVEHPLLRRLAAHVLDLTDLLLFRDQASAANYRAGGGTVDPLVLPDAAMLHGELLSPRPATGRIAISLNGPATLQANLACHWLDLARAIRAAGFEPVFTSNEWFNDAMVWAPWQVSDGFAAEGENLDVDDYVRFLGGFDAVVSGRLHSCVLAIEAGAPVVPVETGTFKLTGLFNQIGLIDRAETPAPGWEVPLVERLRAIAADKQAAAHRQQAIVRTAREKLRIDVEAAFRQRLG